MKGGLAALGAAALLLACDGKPRPAPQPAPLPARTAHAPAPVAPPVAAAPVKAASAEAPTFFAGPADGKLHVYFLDVGQGDATLLVSPTGVTMLIDGGPEREASHLVHRLPELLHAAPDWIVLSDPKPEHLGGLTEAIQVFGGKRFLDPGLPCPSPDYQELLATVAAHQLTRVTPTPDPAAPGAPVQYDLGGGASVAVFWPRAPVEQPLAAGDAFPDANALVMRVSFGRTSLLLTSDMLASTEQYLLNKRLPFHSTLLKVADHGSDSASTDAFLEAVSPRAAVVTSGTGPRDGLPSPDTIARLNAVNARIFRSDLDGEIHAVSDGNTFTLTSERAAAGETPGTPHLFFTTRPPRSDPRRPEGPSATESAPHPAASAAPAQAALAKDVRYVASRKSKIFHIPTCRHALQIKPANLITFKTRAEALQRFKPAADCHP